MKSSYKFSSEKKQAHKQDQAGARLRACTISILYIHNIKKIIIKLKKIIIGFFD